MIYDNIPAFCQSSDLPLNVLYCRNTPYYILVVLFIYFKIKIHSHKVFLFKVQFTLRPLERPSPPLCGLQSGDVEKGGVEVMEEVGGSPF